MRYPEISAIWGQDKKNFFYRYVYSFNYCAIESNFIISSAVKVIKDGIFPGGK